MALAWREDLAIGVPQIDEQHKELFVRLGALLDACNQGKGKAEVGKVVGFLEDYIVEHFAAEEKLQQTSGYPTYVAHKTLHQQFVAEFAKLKQQFEAEGATVRFVIQVNRVLVDWLVNHIGKTDRLLAEYLKAH